MTSDGAVEALKEARFALDMAAGVSWARSDTGNAVRNAIVRIDQALAATNGESPNA